MRSARGRDHGDASCVIAHRRHRRPRPAGLLSLSGNGVQRREGCWLARAGVPGGDAAGRAREMLPPGPDWAVYLDVAEAIQVDPLSGDRDVLLAEEFERRRAREVYDR